MTFDDSEVQWRPSDFSSHDWSYFYCDATDTLPPNMPEPRGLEVQINCFVDANYAGNHITRHLHTGILILSILHQLCGIPKLKLPLNLPHLVLSSLLLGLLLILLNPFLTNFECLTFPLKDQPICLLIIALWY